MKRAVCISPVPIALGMLLEGDVDKERVIPSVALGILVVIDTVGVKPEEVLIPSLSSERRKARDNKTVLAKVLGTCYIKEKTS